MKILFVGHEASRTGSPIILLHLLRYLKREEEWQIDLMLIKGGSIVSEYEEILGTSHIFNREKKRIKLRNAVIRKLSGMDFSVRTKTKEYDAIYFNSVDSLKFMYVLKNLHPKARVLLHVHELQIKYSCGTKLFEESKNIVGKYIAVSYAVRDFLIKSNQVDSDQIETIYEFVDKSELSPFRKDPFIPNQKRLIIGGSGTLNTRKGIDAFLSVALQFKSNEKIEFRWVGGQKDTVFYDNQIKEIERMGLDDKVTIIPSTPNRFKEYAQFDLFFLTSREDPFPLVCIENFYIGNPIMCFEDSGGIPELIAEHGGFLVPYMDTTKAVEKIVEISENPEELAKVSKGYSFDYDNYDINYACTRIKELIENTAN